VRAVKVDIAAMLRIIVLSTIEAGRNRSGLVLLFVIPAVFITIVHVTVGTLSVAVKLYFFRDLLELIIGQKDVSLVFICGSISGFMSAYYSLVLFQQNSDYYRYCVFNGLNRVSLLAGQFAFFGIIAIILSAFIAVLLHQFVSLNSFLMAWTGFLLITLIYGAIGAIAGSLSKDFLVALLIVALLADIDAAWLQNPVYYSTAQNMNFIRILPAYFPCQFIFTAAFTSRHNLLAVAGSLMYLGLLLGILLCIRLIKMRRRNKNYY
jgi:hypothetical protein